jgi:hypothetical protein
MASIAMANYVQKAPSPDMLANICHQIDGADYCQDEEEPFAIQEPSHNRSPLTLTDLLITFLVKPVNAVRCGAASPAAYSRALELVLRQ